MTWGTIRRATSTVSSRDTSSTRITWWTRSAGMSAYVRSSVLAALYAGMTTMTRGWSGMGDRVVPRCTGRDWVEGPRADGYPDVVIVPQSVRRGRCARMPATPVRGVMPRESPRMFERLFGGQTKDPAVMDRVPPGQYVTEKFPV